jgi:hypothetical protein
MVLIADKKIDNGIKPAQSVTLLAVLRNGVKAFHWTLHSTGPVIVLASFFVVRTAIAGIFHSQYDTTDPFWCENSRSALFENAIQNTNLTRRRTKTAWVSWRWRSRFG